MKIKILEDARVIISNYGSIHNYFGWPTVKRLKNGRLALGASGFRLQHVCPFGKAVLSFSDNDGKSWTASAPIIDTVLDDRDAGLCPFGESGLIITSFNNTRKMQKDYLNSGGDFRAVEEKAYILGYLSQITDKQEQAVLGSTYKVSHDNGITFGPLHISPITSPHGPIQLRDGRILWVGTQFYSQNGQSKVDAYEMDLNGGMIKIGSIENIELDGKLYDFCEPYTLELSDGTLICHLRSNHFSTFQSISKDGGRTWTKPEKLWQDDHGAPVHLLELSNGYIVGTYSYRLEPYGICAMLSKDKGQTWDIQNHIYINPFSPDLGYPSTVELNDGSFLTVFYAVEKEGGPSVIMQIRWTLED